MINPKIAGRSVLPEPVCSNFENLSYFFLRRTLADILIGKAEEGVQVNIMIWSEATSGDYVGEKGVCGTHDMETFNRFKSTKVRCALVPRELEVKEFTDVLQTSFAAGTYTHHQKTIVVDAENASSGSGSRYDDQSRGTIQK